MPFSAPGESPRINSALYIVYNIILTRIYVLGSKRSVQGYLFGINELVTGRNIIYEIVWIRYI